MKHPATSTRRAFTLVEALCTIVILGAIGSVVSGIILRASRSYIEVAQRGQLHDELASAMDRIERELREIPLATGSTNPAITSVANTSIVWTRASASCSLTLSGTDILLTDTSGVSAVLASNVSSFLVASYDESNSPIAQPLSGTGTNAVRRLAVTITMTRQGLTDTLRCRVFLRSTMERGQG